MVDKSTIREFIAEVKSSAEKNRFFFAKDRKKNRETITVLGLSPNAVREVLSHLSVKDFSHSIPTQNGSKVNVFGVIIDEYEIYIKLRMQYLWKECFCTCISFHISEDPLSYPFKGGNG